MFDVLLAVLLWRLKVGAAPAMDFGVAIRKRNATGTAVIAGREIHNLVLDHINREVAVINTVVVFINEDQRIGGGEPKDLTAFSEGLEAGVPSHVEETHPAIHG